MALNVGGNNFESSSDTSVSANNLGQKVDELGLQISDLRRKKEMSFWFSTGLSSGLQALVLYAGWEKIKDVLSELGDKTNYNKLLKEIEPDSSKRSRLEAIIEMDIDMQAQRIDEENLGAQYGSGDNFRRVFKGQKLDKGTNLGMSSFLNLANNGEEVSSLLKGIDSVDDDIYSAIQLLETEIEDKTNEYTTEISTLISQIEVKVEGIKTEEDTLIEETRTSHVCDISKLYGDLGLETDEAKGLTTQLGAQLEEMIPVKIAIIEARKQERIDPLLEEIKRLDSFQKNLT